MSQPKAYIPPYKRRSSRESYADAIKINIRSNKIIYINKNKINLFKVSLHQNCSCLIPTQVLNKYKKGIHYIFQSKKNKKVWFIVKKQIIQTIFDRDCCKDVFPCRYYNQTLQVNGFPWIVSDSCSELTLFREKCKEVYTTIRSHSKVTRDYHDSAIINCGDNEKKVNSLSEIVLSTIKSRENNVIKGESNDEDKEVYFGFTSPHMPTSNEFFALGIIQMKVKGCKKWNKNHFNAPGGKKELFWDSNEKKFIPENLIDSVIRETWEELGIEFDKNLFNKCIELSKEHEIKGLNKNKTQDVVVYNLFLPSFEKLNFEQLYWDDPERARYRVSLVSTETEISTKAPVENHLKD